VRLACTGLKAMWRCERQFCEGSAVQASRGRPMEGRRVRSRRRRRRKKRREDEERGRKQNEDRRCAQPRTRRPVAPGVRAQRLLGGRLRTPREALHEGAASASAAPSSGAGIRRTKSPPIQNMVKNLQSRHVRDQRGSGSPARRGVADILAWDGPSW